MALFCTCISTSENNGLNLWGQIFNFRRRWMDQYQGPHKEKTDPGIAIVDILRYVYDAFGSDDLFKWIEIIIVPGEETNRAMPVMQALINLKMAEEITRHYYDFIQFDPEKDIYISLQDETDEEFQIHHPAAYVTRAVLRYANEPSP